MIHRRASDRCLDRQQGTGLQLLMNCNPIFWKMLPDIQAEKGIFDAVAKSPLFPHNEEKPCPCIHRRHRGLLGSP